MSDISETNKSLDNSKRIIVALRKIMQSMDTHSRKLLKEYEITIPQVMCLYELFENSNVTLATLANNIHLTSSTLVGIVDRLEEKELVTRTRSNEDRRAVYIEITEKGKKFVSSTPHLLHNRLQQSIASLGNGEQLAIAQSLELLVQLLNNHKENLDC